MEPPEQTEPGHPEGSRDADALLEAIGGLLLPTLRALDTVRFAARHLHPLHLQALVEAVLPAEAPMRAGLDAARAARWPHRLREFRAAVLATAEITGRIFDGLREAAAAGDIRAARRALRPYAEACEALWPAARVSPAVSRFFLDDAAREDDALCTCLDEADVDGKETGVFHFDNEPGSRGGFSLFVPETYDPAAPPPLVMALHGGSGHGRAFLWSWLPAARAAGVVLAAPTAVGRTWALQGEDPDTPNLFGILGQICERWTLDGRRRLLTGMSDGGTFCWTSGLPGESPFTHLAPFSASFHPLLAEFANPERLRGLPVHIVHGALDWMFPPDVAVSAARSLEARGARVVHREIADLPHTFATDETAAVIDWFLNTPPAGGT